MEQIYTSMHYFNVKTNRFHIVKMEPQILTYLGKHEIYDIEDNFTDHICKIHRKFCQAVLRRVFQFFQEIFLFSRFSASV